MDYYNRVGQMGEGGGGGTLQNFMENEYNEESGNGWVI